MTFNQAYSFLFGMLGAIFVVLIANHIQPHQKQIATVNVTRLIRQFSQLEAKKNLSDEDLKRDTKLFSNQLEDTLKNFSRQNHLIIVPTEAVITGSVDYTAIIMQEMRDKR